MAHALQTSPFLGSTGAFQSAALQQRFENTARRCPLISSHQPSSARCQAASGDSAREAPAVTRRAALNLAAAAAVLANSPLRAQAASLPKSDDTQIRLVSKDEEAGIEKLPLQTTSSGLQYRDLVAGEGPSPPVGFQVTVHYVAQLPDGRIFNSSLEKGSPYIIRVGAGQVLKGLDEGLLTMKTGGKRRLYIPGDLAFPKGLGAAAGRPRVPPSSPVVFDVQLLYIPGISDDLASEEEASA
ncbi:FKBP-type peptidyl-prolyl cis-trans isomerase family protein [Klebsormidium nitens]|uniref:peptidylprolyl isomerase n=1 Tax=Klebsormidium nitens TaxID=105231 RepID=A0A1Y1HSB5_KLENI|nr:FKBP-type peptidyl-prolyl cis-trans isomerase family protein [Klebsormidium nitens]|eukprot:GAQ80702.1 FKBP-type peptidyl-prolyl cis-trans isomerase family protein [Klebsormidium nitens]